VPASDILLGAVPLQVFLSHASADKPLVEEVKRLLEDGGDIQCWLDSFEIDYGDNIASKINDGLESHDALLFFVSSASLKSRWVREEWTASYWDQVNSGKKRLIPVLIGDCEPPALLKNKKYCDLRTNILEGVRKLKTSLLKQAPARTPAVPAGASLPNFTGREADLAELKDRLSQPGSLVPIIGMPGLGKTYLAREFIRRHGDLFEDVYELECQKKDLAALSGELSTILGLRLEGEAERVAAELRQYLSGKQCLLLLDNVEDDQPGQLVPGGRAAALVTARKGDIPFLAEYPELKPPLFTYKEAAALFERICGKAPPPGVAEELFKKLGYLPIGIAVAAGLIKHDLRHTVASLAAVLPPLEKLTHGRNNIGRLLGEALAALEEEERTLLRAMAACAPSGVRLEFAAEVAELNGPVSLNSLQGLYSRSLAGELDRSERRYRLHPLVREAASCPREVRQRHAELVRLRLEKWDQFPLETAEFIEEAEQALRAPADEASRVVATIAARAGHLCSGLGRLSEAYDFYLRLEKVAGEIQSDNWRQGSYGNQALILKAWGRLEEAMALLKNQENICRDLGDRVGLQASYGNQALILRAWGRLEEAMALHKQEEDICRELGDHAGLQRSYGNQALILRAWGRLEEAMALHKQEEDIGRELGDRAGLQRSYGNQALILQAWGRLEEAMAFHKQEENICRERGDRAGLQASYGNQALILRAWGRLEEAMGLLKNQEDICCELGDRAGLQASCGNQALILKAWGRLEEAMALHKQQEDICRELADRAGLQACYGNQALILKDWDRFDEAMALLKKQEDICRELGDRAGLQASYGNQAVILKAWGRLEEAMALLKKKEDICRELGNRAGLAICYANWGLLERERGNSAHATAKLREALAIFAELKMVREADAVREALEDGGKQISVLRFVRGMQERIALRVRRWAHRRPKAARHQP
jgi:tetratricopeptide (TPR) repeat protein